MKDKYHGKAQLIQERKRLQQRTSELDEPVKRGDTGSGEVFEQRFRLERLLSELSATFANLPASEIDQNIQNGLRVLAEHFGIDRCFLAPLGKEGAGMDFTHHWIADGPEKDLFFPEVEFSDLLPWVSGKLLRNEIFVCKCPEDLQPEALNEKRYFQERGIKSGIFVPIKAGDSVIGTLVFEAIRSARIWRDELVQRLRLVGEIFSNALMRKTAEEELHRYELIVLNSRNPIGIIDRDYTLLFLNDAYAAYMNKKPGELIGRNVREVVDKHFFNKTLKPVYDRCLSGEDIHIHLWYKFTDTVKRYLDIRYSPFLDSSGNIGGVVASSADITEIKDAEEKLRKAYNEIKQLKDRLEAENIYLRNQIKLKYSHREMVGESEALKNVLYQAEQVANTQSSVLILGETGTGKELLARAIHEMSSRRKKPMATVNCAALPASLIESELFGHEKGAYTSAMTKQVGRFEDADGSTILLDEISELPFEVQAKLLRVLQEGQFERLGSSKTTTVDVRVIASTNTDLVKAVREGRFRQDLFYRLNVFPITLPPLRERREDIPLLVWAFVNHFRGAMGKKVDHILGKNMEELKSYHWPGNVRELRNVIERAMILCNTRTLRVNLPELPDDSTVFQGKTIEEVERQHILNVLEMTNWRVSGESGAAKILGLKRTTLDSRMRKLGINRPNLLSQAIPQPI